MKYEYYWVRFKNPIYTQEWIPAQVEIENGKRGCVDIMACDDVFKESEFVWGPMIPTYRENNE